MERHKITVTVEGEITIEVSGIKGPTCKDATKAIERALGTVKTDKNSQEFYEKPLVQTVCK